MNWNIREEKTGDEAAIHALTAAAFAPMPYSGGTESAIIDALREAGDLVLSLVAESSGEIIGQITFSPVTIDGKHDSWFGLGPVSVVPEHQSKGIGSALIKAGLEYLRSNEAMGCVLVGNPDYYGRFGFYSDPDLRYGDFPIRVVQQLPLVGDKKSGVIKYCDAFEQGV